MSKILAIKGDKNRGNEVIALLKMLGGKNKSVAEGEYENLYYSIDDYGDINYISELELDEEFTVFTLDEFYEKYPFKVGDKVTLDNKLCTVIWMCWECNNIYYAVHVQGTIGVFTKKVTADELKPYKETNMSKKLAIKGHSTRGKEVIELLEMLGGSPAGATKGFRESYCYYISENTATRYISWDYIGPEKIDKYKIFTLEEFYEKYPFKVGDKVVYTKFEDDCNDYPIVIKSMKWTGTTIEYEFDGYFTCLAKDLKMWKSKDNNTNISEMKNVLAELFEHIKTTPSQVPLSELS